MYGCPNCGANLRFDIEKQMLFCGYCDTVMDPYEVLKEKDAEESDEYEVTVFTCPQCGGRILSEDNTAATFCSFCGAATILDSRISRERKPARIIPFQKTGEDCRKSYKRMMRRAFFAPKELMDEKNIEKFRGIYMPYWVYSFEKKEQITVPGSKTHRRGDYRITKHYDLTSDIDMKYSGIAFDASAAFSDSLSDAIAPFDMRESKPFTPSFLSGFYADTEDVDSGTYIDRAEDVAAGDGSGKFLQHSECRKYHVTESSVKSRLKSSRSDRQLAMLPVWFLAYRNQDRVAYAVVNGQTGKAAADLPVDFKKYLIGSLLLAVPVFVLLNLFWTITPMKILVIAALLALVSALISNRQSDRIFTRESERNGGRTEGADTYGEAPERKKRTAGGASSGRLVKTMMIPVFFIMIIPMFTMFGVNLMLRSRHFDYTSFLIVFFALLIGGSIWIGKRMSMGKSSSKKSKNGEVLYKAPLKTKLPTLIKPLAGIGVAILILLAAPAEDLFYYLGAVICMVMTAWSFRDLIEHHNMLTTRRLPQLGRRGGDENV